MPIECSILPYYHFGKLEITLYPDGDGKFETTDVEIRKKLGWPFSDKYETVYRNSWKMSELKKLVTTVALQDIFPELMHHLSQRELENLNSDKGTLLELLNDPWHKKAHESTS